MGHGCAETAVIDKPSLSKTIRLDKMSLNVAPLFAWRRQTVTVAEDLRKKRSGNNAMVPVKHLRHSTTYCDCRRVADTTFCDS